MMFRSIAAILFIISLLVNNVEGRVYPMDVEGDDDIKDIYDAGTTFRILFRTSNSFFMKDISVNGLYSLLKADGTTAVIKNFQKYQNTRQVCIGLVKTKDNHIYRMDFIRIRRASQTRLMFTMFDNSLEIDPQTYKPDYVLIPDADLRMRHKTGEATFVFLTNENYTKRGWLHPNDVAVEMVHWEHSVKFSIMNDAVRGRKAKAKLVLPNGLNTDHKYYIVSLTTSDRKRNKCPFKLLYGPEYKKLGRQESTDENCVCIGGGPAGKNKVVLDYINGNYVYCLARICGSEDVRLNVETVTPGMKKATFTGSESSLEMLLYKRMTFTENDRNLVKANKTYEPESQTVSLSRHYFHPLHLSFPPKPVDLRGRNFKYQLIYAENEAFIDWTDTTFDMPLSPFEPIAQIAYTMQSTYEAYAKDLVLPLASHASHNPEQIFDIHIGDMDKFQ